MKFTDGGIVFEEDGLIHNFPSSVELDGNEWILYASYREGIRRITGAPGNFRSEPVRFDNLPDGAWPTQAIHMTVPGEGERLYFWLHWAKGGMIRFIFAIPVAAGKWHIANLDAPCLYHYMDRASSVILRGANGLAWSEPVPLGTGESHAPAELVVNDATTIYRLPDGNFELFTAAVRPVPADSPAFAATDNAPGYQRIIRRYTSVDGRHFQLTGVVLEPDENDPPGLQFYYLAVDYRGDRRIGRIGHYDAHAQTVDFEWCESTDGIHWRRHRRAEPARREDEYALYSSANTVEFNGEFCLFYSALNYTHNHKKIAGECEIARIKLLKITDWSFS
jgi:hypothetical protein